MNIADVREGFDIKCEKGAEEHLWRFEFQPGGQVVEMTTAETLALSVALTELHLTLAEQTEGGSVEQVKDLIERVKALDAREEPIDAE